MTLLRLRLVLIILIPLLLIAGIVSAIAVYDAQQRAAERLTLAYQLLAISRDVALSGGDALSPETNSLLQDTSGGPVLSSMHPMAFSSPAMPHHRSLRRSRPACRPITTAVIKGRTFARFTDAMQIEGPSGEFTFTVWQDKVTRCHRRRPMRRTFQLFLPDRRRRAGRMVRRAWG